MKNLKSPLGIFALLYLIYGVVMNFRMFTEKMWPTYLFFLSIFIGLLFLLLNKPTKKLNNYRFWQTIIGLTPVTIFYIYMQVLNYNDPYETEQKIKVVAEGKFEKYKNSELLKFYTDYQSEITEIIWDDEPPGKLAGVIFITNNKSYEIKLDSIPEDYKMNVDFDWKMKNVGKSIIRDIRMTD